MIGAVACGAIAIALLYWFYPSKARLDHKKVAAAEDEVYAAVVRDMFLPNDRRSNVTQLVLNDTLGTYTRAGSDTKSCEESAREQLELDGNTPPPFDSFADRAYRVLSGGWYDSSFTCQIQFRTLFRSLAPPVGSPRHFTRNCHGRSLHSTA